jgi:menaquinol-cytochrome c reductase iron-sulfur subunit
VRFENAGALPWDGVSARTGAWLRRIGERDFVAFTLNCTHLGCPVLWQPGANLFMCPCHGGVYDRDGNVVSGPPPRGLERLNVRVNPQTSDLEVEL